MNNIRKQKIKNIIERLEPIYNEIINIHYAEVEHSVEHDNFQLIKGGTNRKYELDAVVENLGEALDALAEAAI